MVEEDYIRKKYVHKCTLSKFTESIDEVMPDANFITKKFRKFCLVSQNVSHRRIYVKSSRVLDKERRAQLLNYFYLIHPFSEFNYYWEIIMIIVNTLQLLINPIIIINRVKFNFYTMITLITQMVGFFNIIIQFNTGYYRYDIKEVRLDRKEIAIHYLKTLFVPDFVGNFPIRVVLILLDVDTTIIIISSIAIACNTGNFVKCFESLREKRDLDLVIVRLLVSFAMAGIGLLWITALCSIAANLDQSDKSCKGDTWWWIYLNFILLTGTSLNEFTFVGYEIICKAIALTFGFVMRYSILVQLILFFKTYTVNRLKKNRLMLELNEFCYNKKLPYHLRANIFNSYLFKFSNVYYNESDVWILLSESMKQNILDYDAKQWFEGDIFKLCPLVLRQLISINLDKEIFLKDDVIYSCNNIISSIYFIKTGTVAQYEDDGNLVHLIDEGNFFSERALLLQDEMKHMYTAIAYENCQLFSLKIDAFKKLIKNFEVEYDVILDILSKRHEYLLQNKHVKRRMALNDYYSDHELYTSDSMRSVSLSDVKE